MQGIVLCGGQSLRMGSDKGLLTYQQKLWAQLASEKLSSIGIPTKFSINLAQFQAYNQYFNEKLLLVDAPSLTVKGPLLGILSAHLVQPDENFLLMACDLLLMEKSLLQLLIDAFKTNSSFGAYVFKKHGKTEPLCGIYMAKGLQKINRLLHTDQLQKYSMRFVLENLSVYEIEVEHKDLASFENFNSQTEVDDLSKL